MKVRALALLSGGLDSTLAVRFRPDECGPSRIRN